MLGWVVRIVAAAACGEKSDHQTESLRGSSSRQISTSSSELFTYLERRLRFFYASDGDLADPWLMWGKMREMDRARILAYSHELDGRLG